MKNTFLTAEWKNLIMINYEIDPSLLLSFLPSATELDSFDGKYYVSLVAFMFKNNKILGLKIPFHINFEEVNLRFYVKHIHKGEERRGVVFIKEIVPKRMISIIANAFYNENYQTMQMKHKKIEDVENRKISYSFKQQKNWQKIEVRAENKAFSIKENSIEEFIAEHYFGYTKVDEKMSSEYEVQHPKWKVFPVWDYGLEIDFGALYGTQFSFLNTQKPANVFLAEGSEVSILNKRIVRKK